MRTLLLAFLLCLGPSLLAQHLTFQEWSAKSVRDMRLIPRFGDRHKSPAQKESDAEFIRMSLEQIPDRRKASEAMVAHGFELLKQGNLTHAMYRFNHAFLLDSTNSDVYWGYGSFFMELDQPSAAHTLFRAGLSTDTTNAHLFTGEATAYLAEHYAMEKQDPAAAKEVVTKALAMLVRAERHAPKDPAVLYRLAVCHLLQGNCAKARKYYTACKDLPNPPVEAGFEQRLAAACPAKGE